jgi:endo-1,4-beta-xylanase
MLRALTHIIAASAVVVIAAGCKPADSDSTPTPAAPTTAPAVAPVAAVTKPVAAVPSPAPVPFGGAALLPADIFTTFGAQAQLEQSGKVEVLPDTATPHGKVIRLTLTKRPAESWHAQARWKTVAPIERGRAMLVRMLVRAPVGAPETGDGRFEVVVQKSSSPWSGFGQPLSMSAKQDWKWIDVPMVAGASYPADGVQIAINFGFAPQVLEIADVQALLFPSGVALSSLPSPSITYEGRESNARWRKDAAGRIERYRKGDLSVTVVDAAGTPVAGAQVDVRMTRHAFLFGTCINGRLLNDGPDGDQYRTVVENLFNVVVHEGAMKWVDMDWVGGFEKTARKRTPEERAAHIANVKRILDWTEARGIKTRGHAIIWPGWGKQWAFLPPYLRLMVEAGDTEGVRREIDARFRTALDAFKGRLIEWDVVNESVRNTDLQKFLGREELVRWYKLAKEIDPNSVNVINDYMMLSGGAIPERVDAFYDEVKWLLDNGAPIDAIAEQAHFGWDLPGMEQSWTILERFAAFGKPMRITEFDIAIADEKLQADYTRDFYTLMFSHPQMEQILMWGFWEGSHWMPSAAMFRRDWTPKPNYYAFHDLVFQQWWTNVSGATDARGAFATRGFLGEYQISVTVNGVTTTRRLSLGGPGASVTVVAQERRGQ